MNFIKSGRNEMKKEMLFKILEVHLCFMMKVIPKRIRMSNLSRSNT